MTAPDQPAESAQQRRRRLLVLALTVGLAAVLVAAAAFLLVRALTGDDERGVSLTADTAEAGQCIDLATSQGRVDITEASCDGGHDAEIVLTTTVGDAVDDDVELDDPETACRTLLGAAGVARLDAQGEDLAWGLLIDEPSNVDPFDRLVCYVRAADGRLADQLLD